jgi:hypothetical protein
MSFAIGISGDTGEKMVLQSEGRASMVEHSSTEKANDGAFSRIQGVRLLHLLQKSQV